MDKRALQAVATIGDVPPSVAAAYALGFKAGSAFNLGPTPSSEQGMVEAEAEAMEADAIDSAYGDDEIFYGSAR